MSRCLPILMLLTLALTGCRGDGHLTFLGYSAKPLHDEDIRTVYVPVFKNFAVQATTDRELEVEITKAIIREIEQRTHMKVISDRERADTELLGSLVTIRKNTLNTTQQNLSREVELSATVSLVWRDLRSGKVLTNRRKGRAEEPVTPFDPSLPPVPELKEWEKAVPVLLTATGRVLPELGETNATGNQAMVNQLARQIVNMMETGW